MSEVTKSDHDYRLKMLEEVKERCKDREGLTAGQSKGVDRLVRWKIFGRASIDGHALALIGTILQSTQYDVTFIRSMRNATKLGEDSAAKVITYLKEKCSGMEKQLRRFARVCDNSLEIEEMYQFPTEEVIIEVTKEIEAEKTKGIPKKLYFDRKTPATYDEVLEQVLADDSNDDLFRGLHNLIKMQYRRFEGLIKRSMDGDLGVTEKDIDSCADSIRKTWDTLGKFQIAADLLKTQQEQLADNVRNSYHKYIQNFDEESRKSVGAGMERMLGWLKTKSVDREPATSPLVLDVLPGGEES